MLIAVHVAALIHIAHWRVSGSTLTPVEPSEAGQALEFGYVNAGLVLLLLAVLATLFFGRFFCGWACHVVAYQDLAAWLAARVGLRPRAVRSRALALVPFVAALIVFGEPLARRLGSFGSLPEFVPQFRTGEFWATFPGFWMGALTFAVDGFLIVWFLGSKGFCTYACPYGAFFGVADRLSPARIRVTDACESCGHCTSACTSNVRVHEEVARFGMVVDTGCMKCMDCVSVCPKDALYYGRKSAGQAAERTRKARRRPTRAWDFSWPEEIAAGLAFVLGLYAFRLAYNAVPLMLALGLAVLAAAAAIVVARLFVRRDSAWQGHALKREGRWTATGGAVFALGVGWLALVGHTAAVQVVSGSGERAMELAGSSEGALRAAHIAEASAALGQADRWGLFDDSAVQNQLGQIALADGDWDVAAGHFERAIAANARMRSPRILLAEAELRRGHPDGVERALTGLLERHPEDLEGLQKLALLYLNDPARLAEAEPLLERLTVEARRADETQLQSFAERSLATLRGMLGSENSPD